MTIPHSNDINSVTNGGNTTIDNVLKRQNPAHSGLKTELSDNDTLNESTPNTNATLYQPKPIFSKTWDFNSSSQTKTSRSVSPVQSVASSLSPTTFSRPPLRKRTSVYDEKTAIPLTLPPMNPRSPSLNNFKTNIQKQTEGSFQYVPLNKRLKLANVGGRRRSSILSVNGSLPDKVLIRIFEYLLLPELMKLRIVSRRWRQLLNAAPNLMNVLDLTPWNTSITDKVLIQITDFVGSRPRHLNISNCFHITDEGFSYMINEIGMAGRIKSLKMRSDWEISAMAIMDLTAPSVGKYLEELDLSNCRKVQDDVLIRLIGWNSSNSQNDPFEMDYDSDRIGCKNLRILNVSYCKHITDKFMLHLSKNSSPQLECLDLTRCTAISNKGFQFWTYNSFPNLKKVSLKDCTFVTDQSIMNLTRAAPNLEILNSNFCCSLTEVAIDVLCLGCLNLRELDLSFCGSAVSDSSLVAISLQLRKLERLIVRGCTRVTRAGIDTLLSGYAPLKFIDISQCKNAHAYPEGIPAQQFNVNPVTKSAFVIAGPYQKVIEIVI
jgi:F-box/leucine-rich repeat protein 7